MIRRIGKRKYNIYSFDIESHNDDESIKLQQTSAWLLCFIDENSKIEDESNYFYSMIDFLNHLKDISSKKVTRTLLFWSIQTRGLGVIPF